MEHLFAPWRYTYVSGADDTTGCIFCAAAAREDGELVLLRGSGAFAMLNRYPYTSGHAMVAPFVHVAALEDVEPAVLGEMLAMAQSLTRALREVYRPHGFNLGINLGESAGAGVPGHLHLHVVPRWRGDTNFMTVTGGVRVIPEDLGVACERIRRALGVDDA